MHFHFLFCREGVAFGVFDFSLARLHCLLGFMHEGALGTLALGIKVLASMCISEA